jgi:scyllo-inositol 2-dehydrogenase (NADP+)
MGKHIIKVGIAGLGRSGWNLHVRQLKKDRKYKIVAVCDVMDDRLRQARKTLKCAVYRKYEDFIAHPGMDLVIIATPTRDHFYMAEAALKEGLNVVLEKPVTGSLKQVRKLQLISRKAKRILSPFYNFRFSNDFLSIKKILDSGLVGMPFLIKRQVGYFNRRDDWQSSAKESGGILNAATIHYIDQVIQLFGCLPRVKWFDLRKAVSKGDAADHSKLILAFPGGCIADIEVSWAEAINGFEWLIYGPRGAIMKKDDELRVKWFEEKEIVSGKAKSRSYFSGEKIKWKEMTYKINTAFSTGYYDLLYKAVRGNGPLPVTLSSAMDAMLIIDQCRKQNERKA